MAALTMENEEAKFENEPAFDLESLTGPQPAEEQDWLWQELEGRVAGGALERTSKYLDLPYEERELLARAETSARIGATAEQFGLTPRETAALAALVKYAFIGEFPKREFTVTMTRLFGFDETKARGITHALQELLDKAGTFKPLEKKTRAAIAPELDALPRVSAERRETTPPAGGTTEAPQGSIAPLPPQEDAPFILHEEQGASGGPLSESAPDAIRPSFSFRPRDEQKPPQPPKPVSVRIETNKDKEEDGAKTRIVHYSKFRTPLDSDSSNAQ